MQTSKRILTHTHTHAHMHTSHAYVHVAFIVAALANSRVQLERKKEEKAKVGCDWRVRCSDKPNLHTQKLRSEYA